MITFIDEGNYYTEKEHSWWIPKEPDLLNGLIKMKRRYAGRMRYAKSRVCYGVAAEEEKCVQAFGEMIRQVKSGDFKIESNSISQ